MSGENRTPSANARATAAGAPDTWVYEIDPWFDPDGAVPPFGILGGWHSDERGEITGEFQVNPSYRPSPRARGFRQPSSVLEGAMQLETTEYGEAGGFAAALSEATVWIVATPGHEDEFTVIQSSAGRVVEAYTSSELIANGPSSGQPTAPIRLSTMLERLPADIRVVLNPGTPPTLVIPETPHS